MKRTPRTAATWPRIEVEIDTDGSGRVRTAGLVTAELAGDGWEDARQQAIVHLARTARQLGRPVHAATRVPQGSWAIVVEPDGTVRAADAEPGQTTKRAKARTTPATTPAFHKREGAGTPGRGVPPTGHDRAPRPPYLPPAPAPALNDVAEGVHGDAGDRTPRRRRPPGRVFLAAGLALVVCAGGAAVWHSVSAGAVASAHAQWVDERLALTAEISAAQDLFATAAGQVSDGLVLSELQDAITAALAARTDPSGGDGAQGTGADQWRDAERDVVGASAVLRAAVEAVEREHAAWALEQAGVAWAQARAALAGAVDEAAGVVASTAGQVTDDAVRQTLAAAIETATQARDVEVEAGDVDALTQATAAANTAREALGGPVQAARDAQAAWIAEQERAAAAQAAAAAVAAKPATSKPAPSTSRPPSAPAAQTPAQGGGSSISIDPGTVRSSTKNPGQVTVSATTSGVTGPVVVTIGEFSQTIGTGSGYFEAVITGLAPGSYSWSVSADGVVAAGSGMAVVP